jgi:transposase
MLSVGEDLEAAAAGGDRRAEWLASPVVAGIRYQLDMQTLHRSRDRLVGERTALINQLRAILLERGMVAPQGKRKLEEFLSVLMDEQDGAGLSPRMAILVADVRAQWAELDRRITAFDGEFVRWARENEDARRLVTIPGFLRGRKRRRRRTTGPSTVWQSGQTFACAPFISLRNAIIGGRRRPVSSHF